MDILNEQSKWTLYLTIYYQVLSLYILNVSNSNANYGHEYADNNMNKDHTHE